MRRNSGEFSGFLGTTAGGVPSRTFGNCRLMLSFCFGYNLGDNRLDPSKGKPYKEHTELT